MQDDTGPAAYGPIYFWPNEKDPHVFRPSIKDKTGVYIGVGTFRTFSALGMGQYSHGILMDYNRDTGKFNTANLLLIQSCTDRKAYLSGLFGVEISSKMMSDLDAGTSPEEWKSLDQRAKADPLRTHEILTKNATPQKLWELSNKIFPTPEQWQATIFGSDAIFRRIKVLTEKGAIDVVSGDIANRKESFSSMQRELRAKKLTVSTVDISNVLGAVGNDKTQTIVDNFRQLPLADDAILLFTSDHFRFPHEVIEERGWSYSFMEFKKFPKSEIIEKTEPAVAKTSPGLLKRLCNKLLGFIAD